jgi:hypothetical protein
MTPTLDRKLRFSDAVYAIGTTPKQLRNWLQRRLVEIDTPRPENGGWSEYSFYDIAILALVKRLVDFGIEVSAASDIANKTMEFHPVRGELTKIKEIPANALAIMWSNQRLWVHRTSTSGQWHLHCVQLWMNPKEPDLAFLSIDVEKVLLEAVTRAWESVTDGGDDSQ